MEKLQADIAGYQGKLGDPQLYSRDPKTFADVSAKLTKAQTDLAKAEESWLELEMLREELEG
jgi:ATP-binding cassette subfamily F protein uup